MLWMNYTIMTPAQCAGSVLELARIDQLRCFFLGHFTLLVGWDGMGWDGMGRNWI
jgi:hypothetical protein